MAIKLDDLVALRQKIEADRKKLEEQEHALRVLEQMLGVESTGSSSGAPPTFSGPVDINKLDVRAGTEPTLSEKITEAIERFGDQEFTVPHVEAMLKELGYKIGGKTPRARIAMVMSALEKKGKVTRTSRPSGGRPHTFKLSTNSDSLKLACLQ